MKKIILVSLMTLGSLLFASTGMIRTAGSELNSMAPGWEKEELRGTEFPFPVGFVPESMMTEYGIQEPVETGVLPAEEELRGTEFPFPVGFVPGD
ncbi:MAG TPA: hypothetical protein VH866_07185 [Candidatus Deferrimicrobiaceae bacterium]|jgi:hypothetical protein